MNHTGSPLPNAGQHAPPNRSVATDPAATSGSVSALSLWPLYVAAFAATYTFSIGNVAAPDIRIHLRAGSGEISLVLGAFAAAFAAGLIVAGRLGDRLGRRRVLIWGLTGGVVTALLAAVAPTIHVLIAARVLQGVAAAVMTPQILGTIQGTTFGSTRATAIAAFTATSGVGTAVGQVIGGALISANIAGTGWRGAVASIAVIFAVALVGAHRIPPSRAEVAAATDYLGALLVGVALLCLVAGLSIGPNQHWPWWTIALVAAGMFGGAAFWRQQNLREGRGRDALMPPSVVRLMPVRVGLAMSLVYFSGYGALMYEYALLTQGDLHQSPLLSGVGLIPFAAAFVVTSARIGWLTRRWGARTLERGAAWQFVGLLAVAATSVLVGLAGDLDRWTWWVQLPLILLGFAQGAQFAPLVSSVMAAVPQAVAGLTGGLVSTAQQAALGLGVAVFGSLFVALAVVLPPVQAFGAVLAVQSFTAVAFFVLARRLRRRPQAG